MHHVRLVGLLRCTVAAVPDAKSRPNIGRTSGPGSPPLPPWRPTAAKGGPHAVTNERYSNRVPIEPVSFSFRDSLRVASCSRSVD